MEDGGDAVGVFEGEKAGEDAGGVPGGFGGPGFEACEEGVQGGGVFVGEDDVVAEAFDPAVGAGGEAVGGGAGFGEGFKLGGGDPHGWLRGGAGGGGGVHEGGVWGTIEVQANPGWGRGVGSHEGAKALRHEREGLLGDRIAELSFPSGCLWQAVFLRSAYGILGGLTGFGGDGGVA